jgi:nucleotidyltransferase/DNA polymerase involved in DNA repair
VTQKYLIVTCNYAARALGVTKLMPVAEGVARVKAAASQLVLVCGEDLTPYRDASDALLVALQAAAGLRCAVERGGLDEFVVDLTQASQVEAGDGWADGCVVHSAAAGALAAEAAAGRGVVHRPQDLRSAAQAPEGSSKSRNSFTSTSSSSTTSNSNGSSNSSSGARVVAGEDFWLAAGSRAARRLQAALEQVTGFTSSVSARVGWLVRSLIYCSN